MRLNRIKEISKDQGYKWKVLAAEADLTPEGLDYAIEHNTLKGSIIESISRKLGVSPLEFFDIEEKPYELQEPKNQYGKLATVNDVRDAVRSSEKVLKELREFRREIFKKIT